jgi:hypothetical protein
MKPNEYGLVMKQVAAEIKNPNVRKIYEAAKQQQKGKA